MGVNDRRGGIIKRAHADATQYSSKMKLVVLLPLVLGRPFPPTADGAAPGGRILERLCCSAMRASRSIGRLVGLLLDGETYSVYHSRCFEARGGGLSGWGPTPRSAGWRVP